MIAQAIVPSWGNYDQDKAILLASGLRQIRLFQIAEFPSPHLIQTDIKCELHHS